MAFLEPVNWKELTEKAKFSKKKKKKSSYSFLQNVLNRKWTWVQKLISLFQVKVKEVFLTRSWPFRAETRLVKIIAGMSGATRKQRSSRVWSIWGTSRLFRMNSSSKMPQVIKIYEKTKCLQVSTFYFGSGLFLFPVCNQPKAPPSDHFETKLRFMEMVQIHNFLHQNFNHFPKFVSHLTETFLHFVSFFFHKFIFWMGEWSESNLRV